MSRILFTVPPLIGHLNPALATAEVLRSRGHEVAWAVDTGTLAGHLPRSAVSYPLSEWQLETPRPSTQGLKSILSVYEDYLIPMAKAVFGSLVRAIDIFSPDVMVVDQQMLAGALAARQRRVPWVTLVTTSASIYKMSPQVGEWNEMQMRQLQERLTPALSVAPSPDLSPFGVIVFSIARLLDPGTELIPSRYHFVGPAHGDGRNEVPFPWDWIKPDVPLLLVTLGSRKYEGARRFLSTMLQVISRMEVQAVFATSDLETDQLSSNVLVRPFFPQLKLLDRVAGVVCHGGHNTVCEALARGVPLIVAPIRDDQPTIARQVVQAGVGLSLRYGKATVEVAHRALERLLQDASLRERAQELAGDLQKMQGSEAAANLIETLAATSHEPSLQNGLSCTP